MNKKGQTKKVSLLESIINVFVGIFIACLTQMVVFPLFSINISLSQNVYIALIFTAVSIIRSYFLRRVFNFLHVKEILK
jgi:hypothetical protein